MYGVLAVIYMTLQLLFRKHYQSKDNVFSVFHIYPGARLARAQEVKV